MIAHRIDWCWLQEMVIASAQPKPMPELAAVVLLLKGYSLFLHGW
jgi:hypothetical protein